MRHSDHLPAPLHSSSSTVHSSTELSFVAPLCSAVAAVGVGSGGSSSSSQWFSLRALLTAPSASLSSSAAPQSARQRREADRLADLASDDAVQRAIQASLHSGQHSPQRPQPSTSALPTTVPAASTGRRRDSAFVVDDFDGAEEATRTCGGRSPSPCRTAEATEGAHTEAARAGALISAGSDVWGCIRTAPQLRWQSQRIQRRRAPSLGQNSIASPEVAHSAAALGCSQCSFTLSSQSAVGGSGGCQVGGGNCAACWRTRRLYSWRLER